MCIRDSVIAVAKRSRKQQPPVPFNTTALQAAAAAEGISPARTMRIDVYKRQRDGPSTHLDEDGRPRFPHLLGQRLLRA